jgi:hypothetical protein
MIDGETKERKAADVLLSLEHKVNALQQTVNALSLNISLLLQRTAIKNISIVSPTPSDNSEKKSGGVVMPYQDFQNIVVSNSCVYKEDKKPIRLAKVDILNPEDNSLVVSCMTNHTGVWTCNLRPGKYLTKITKGATAGKIARTYSYSIEITGESPHKQLPEIII